MLIKKKIYNNVKDRIGKDQYYLLSSNKIRRKLKWKDKVSLELGLDLTVKWIKNNFKSLSRMKMEYVHKK
jgi:dTDP-glucose 4,6-dehydratase